MKRVTKKTILITGGKGNLGKALAESLMSEGRFSVISTDHGEGSAIRGSDGLEKREGTKNQVPFYSVSLFHKSIENVFRNHDIHGVVHLDLIHDPREDWSKRNTYNVGGTNFLIQLCAKYKVKKFIFLSTANVYGPSPKNSQLLTENEPLLAMAHSSGPDDIIKADLGASSYFWKFPQLEIVILRPCHIVGPLNNAINHYLKMDRPLTLMGFDPMMQFIHMDDMIEAIRLCLHHKIKGIFNVKGPGEISLHHVLEEMGKRPRTLPSFLGEALLTSLWNLKLTDFPPYELNHLQYSCMVDDASFRGLLPFRPQKTFKEIFSPFSPI